MFELKTWGEKSKFTYEGTVEKGTIIHYGKKYTLSISGEQYSDLLKVFAGKTVHIGTSRTDPPNGSVGRWLLTNITRVAVSSYVGAILVNEGYAEKAGGASIRFL